MFSRHKLFVQKLLAMPDNSKAESSDESEEGKQKLKNLFGCYILFFCHEEMAEPENLDKDAEQETDKQLDEDSKRAITYQIKKNRGLTPHKKKELRNPRVKHRMKFRKAVIRRKGQVR
jgi:hypothetical protein